MLRCGSDIKVALEAEPGLKAVLPSDLGGDGKSYKELVGKKYTLVIISLAISQEVVAI